MCQVAKAQAEAKAAYEAKLKEQQLRQMQSMQQQQQQAAQQGGQPFNPQTPQMTAVIDAASPAQLLGASPRNANGLQMTRIQSKGGAMLPPQSPVTGLGVARSTTPKPKSGLTPKSGREDGLVSTDRILGRVRADLPQREVPTPKSLNPSPSTLALTITAESHSQSHSNVPTPSPSDSKSTNTPQLDVTLLPLGSPPSPNDSHRNHQHQLMVNGNGNGHQNGDTDMVNGNGHGANGNGNGNGNGDGDGEIPGLNFTDLNGDSELNFGSTSDLNFDFASAFPDAIGNDPFDFTQYLAEMDGGDEGEGMVGL